MGNKNVKMSTEKKQQNDKNSNKLRAMGSTKKLSVVFFLILLHFFLYYNMMHFAKWIDLQ